MLYVNIFIIVLAANFIAEKSGVMDQIKFRLYYRIYTRKTKYVPYRLKPFDCTMCLSFWLTLTYILFIHEYNFTLPFAAATAGALISRL
jgi:hypothetical protein